jgi:predicted MFS family arabinose efflux permease
VLILAAACGMSAANLYYAQPLLHTIAGVFGTGPARAGLIVTVSQIGYALGLALLVPAGDIVERRVLVFRLLCMTVAALVVSALAPGIAVLIGVALVVGLGSVAAQILVPLSASLADDDSRGRVVGTVMSGLLLGILLARTLSGLIAGLAGWRAVYWTAAGLVMVMAIALRAVLPSDSDRPQLSYAGVLRSTVTLFLTESVLRGRMLLGSLCFAAFSVFWTTMAFMLAGAPYHYGETTIGLFGLIGAAGALCANLAGRAADHGHNDRATLSFAAAIAGSFALLYLGGHSLASLIVGIVLLDVGVQGLHVTNQSVIYRLSAQARSRITANYMVAYFIGGALGSAMAGTLYAASGWGAICLLGAAIGIAIVGVEAVFQVRAMRVFKRNAS